MDVYVKAMVIQSIGALLSDHIKNRGTVAQPSAMEIAGDFIEQSDQKMKAFIEQGNLTVQHPIRQVAIPIDKPAEDTEKKAESIVSGCIPCSLGHYSTCSGLLNEAVRFAHNGLGHPEVVDRVTMCLGELNALERVDLRPEMINDLSGPEKEMASKSLEVSRSTRHVLEGMNSPDDLIKAAANLQTSQKRIARQWFDYKLRNLSPMDQEEINRRLEEKLRELEEEA